MSLIITCACAAVLSMGQQDSVRPANVAVVDVPAVSARYRRTADLENEFEKRRLKLNEQRDALREKIDRDNRSLQEQFKPGTSDFEQRSKELALSRAELEWFMDTEGQRIEADLAKSLRSIYRDIHTMVGQVAQEHGFDVVLAVDRLPDEIPKSTSQARQQIVLQKVVYWTPQVDLTEEVIARLNTKYAAEHSGAPGLAKPPANPDAALPGKGPETKP